MNASTLSEKKFTSCWCSVHSIKCTVFLGKWAVGCTDKTTGVGCLSLHHSRVLKWTLFYSSLYYCTRWNRKLFISGSSSFLDLSWFLIHRYITSCYLGLLLVFCSTTEFMSKTMPYSLDSELFWRSENTVEKIPQCTAIFSAQIIYPSINNTLIMHCIWFFSLISCHWGIRWAKKATLLVNCFVKTFP